jgi:thioredoxin reductase
VESISHKDDVFVVRTSGGEEYTARKIVLAIGRRGTPRKLNIPGEESMKVAYRLLEPELINGKNITVVGGGDSAVEAALLLAEGNRVTLSYRGDAFGRLKPRNNEQIRAALLAGKVQVKYNTNLTLINEREVVLLNNETGSEEFLENDLVYIFAGGELPSRFLEKTGIHITTKFGVPILKHEK